jgi:hypothetical protein
MKTMFLAAAVALLALGSAAHAEPTWPDRLSNEPQEAAATFTDTRTAQAFNQLQMRNPTGLPAYELRPDGLLRNGLEPADGSQG